MELIKKDSGIDHLVKTLVTRRILRKKAIARDVYRLFEEENLTLDYANNVQHQYNQKRDKFTQAVERSEAADISFTKAYLMELFD